MNSLRAMNKQELKFSKDAYAKSNKREYVS